MLFYLHDTITSITSLNANSQMKRLTNATSIDKNENLYST